MGYIIQISMTPENKSSASTTATTALIAVIVISTLRRLKRSVIMPANGDTTIDETPRAKLTAPTWNGECVRSKTRYPCAANCTHCPSMVPTVPNQSTRQSGDLPSA